MIITCNTVAQANSTARKLEFSCYEFYWIGFIYLPGYPEGEETLRQLAVKLGQMPVEQATLDLRGHYFLVMVDAGNNQTYALIDHSGMFQAFYTATCISASFLELSKHENLSAADLNKEKVIEFIQLGNIFENRTFFDRIHRIGFNEIVTFDDDGQIRKITKNLPPLIREDAEFSFFSFFEEFSESLKNLSISADITGGIDSRLIVAIMDYFGVPYELAISGRKNHPDVIIAEKIAAALNRNICWTAHELDSIEHSISRLFIICDGLCDPLKYHRLSLHQQNRKSRGADVIVSGMGGELYKDFWWLQDFPLYNKKEANITRLFHSRIWSTKCSHNLFGSEYRELSETLSQRMLDDLSSYQSVRNTTTYDLIYYHFKMQTFGSRIVTNNNSFLPCYAPLLERDVVRFGMNLKRSQRFFNRFHRNILSDINPNLAKLGTTEGGMSVSNEVVDILGDLLKYSYDKSARLTKKVAQRMFNKTYFQPMPDNMELYSMVRKLPSTRRYIDIVKDAGVLQPHIDLDQIQDNHLGAFLSMGLLIESLE